MIKHLFLEHSQFKVEFLLSGINVTWFDCVPLILVTFPICAISYNHLMHFKQASGVLIMRATNFTIT